MNNIEYRVVGELYTGKKFEILENENSDNKSDSFYLRDDTGEILAFTFEERILYMSKPWDYIETYESEYGIHYSNIIYDFIWLNIWARNLKELLNLICRMVEPSDKAIHWFSEQNKGVINNNETGNIST